MLQKGNSKLEIIFESAKGKSNKRKFLKTSLSGLFLTIVLVCTLFLNIIVKILGNSYSLKLDLTRNKLFTISPSAVNFIKNIEKDVEIIVLNEENSFAGVDKYFKQANDVLKRFSQISNKIKLNYVDVIKNPTYLNSQNFSSEKLSANSVVVRSGSKYKVVNANDLFDITYGYYGAHEITASKAEQELTSAILYTVSDNQKKIAFLTGYEEPEHSAFTDLLKKNNYNVTEVNLLNQDIPSDVSVAIIFGPSRDYDKAGVTKLNNYLSVGESNLLCALNPQVTSSPNLYNFLGRWKINVKDGIVYETDVSKMTSNRQIFEAISEQVEGSYTKKIKESKVPVLMPVCKPLEALDSTSVKTLLQYSSKSGIIPQGAGENFDIKAHICGPVPVALVSEKVDDEKRSTVTALGSFVGLSDNYILATSLNNSSYFGCLLDSLTKKEDSGIRIEPKKIDNEELGINGKQANVLGLSVTILLPLLVIMVGIFVFFRRRSM